MPGSVSFWSCCSAGVIDSRALRGLSAWRIFAAASCRIFCTCGSTGVGLGLSAIFFWAACTAFAARAWLSRSACRCARTWSIGLGSSASASEKIARTATTEASPRLTLTGKAVARRVPEACRKASRN